jgi:hypothetical protein
MEADVNYSEVIPAFGGTGKRKKTPNSRTVVSALYRKIVSAYCRDTAMSCEERKPTDDSRALLSSFNRKSSKVTGVVKRPYTSL